MVCKYFNRISYPHGGKTLQFRDECWGTKEREVCACGGDRRKCTFYPDFRNPTEDDLWEDFMYILKGFKKDLKALEKKMEELEEVMEEMNH